MNTTANTAANTTAANTTANTAVQLYYSREYFGGCFVKTAQELGRLKMSKAAYAAGLKALEENDLNFKYEDATCSLRAEKVPVIVKPDDADRSTAIKVLREGVYYPGRMGDPTHWWEIEIVYDGGEVVKCFRADMSGYDSDETWLELECSDLEEVEWYDEDEDEEEEYDYTWITSPRESSFKHVRDVLIELKEEGSVTIR